MGEKFLLDEHISPLVAFKCRKEGVDVISLAEAGFLGADDLTIFRKSVQDQRIIITYNSSDFAKLFVDMLKEVKSIPGVVFVNAEKFPTSDIKKIAKALVKLAGMIDQAETDPTGGIYLTS